MELRLKIPVSTEVGFVALLQLAAAAVLVPHCLAAVPEAEPVHVLVAANAPELKQAKDPIATRATAAARAKRVKIRRREKRSERLMGESLYQGKRTGGRSTCESICVTARLKLGVSRKPESHKIQKGTNRAWVGTDRDFWDETGAQAGTNPRREVRTTPRPHPSPPRQADRGDPLAGQPW